MKPEAAPVRPATLATDRDATSLHSLLLGGVDDVELNSIAAVTGSIAADSIHRSMSESSLLSDLSDSPLLDPRGPDDAGCGGRKPSSNIRVGGEDDVPLLVPEPEQNFLQCPTDGGTSSSGQRKPLRDNVHGEIISELEQFLTF